MLKSNPNDRVTCAQIRKLCDRITFNASARSVLSSLLSRRGLKHVCPKCNGEGYIKRVVNTYPSGLPDSGWVDQMDVIWSECDLCKGEGYTADEYEKQVSEVKYVKKH